MSLYIYQPNFVVIGRSAAELWRHINFSRWRPQSRKCTSGLRLSDGIWLTMWKSICLPNFDEISHFTAEIKVLPDSENGRPPFWNSISGFDFWGRYSHRHVILHLPAKFRSTSGFRFSDWIRLRMCQSICLPNLDEISQSTAKIKLLPVSENERPPFWNYISGFDFDECIVIGMSFYIYQPNFVVIARSAAELWRHINFSRWRPQSRKCTSGFRFSDGIWLRMWKSMRLLNFDKIYHSTAEIKLLLVSENGRPTF